MNTQFITGHHYTLIAISDYMAHTVRHEITITRYDEAKGRPVYRNKGKRKEYYLNEGEIKAEQLIFEGHNLPFVIDSETNRFMGNARFNFVTDDEAALRKFIEEKCLNPDTSLLTKILAVSTSETVDPVYTPLFAAYQ